MLNKDQFILKMVGNIINDDVEALARKSQARFQIIQVSSEALPKYLQTCLDLNPIIVSINLRHP